MGSLRDDLIKHLDTLRAFILELHKVDSGLYTADQVDTLLSQPHAFKHIDRDWINRLCETLGYIEGYLRIVWGWADHFYSVAFSLGATYEEATRIREREVGSVTVFKTKIFERDYLHSVLAGLKVDAERVLADSEALLDKGPRLFELIRQFGGPYFEKVLEIGMAWVAVDRSDFRTPLKGLLKGSQTAKTSEELIISIGRYLDQVTSLVATIPVFVGLDAVLNFTDRQMEASREGHQKLISQAEYLQEYVEQYHQVLKQLNHHLIILLSPVLPSTTPVQQWIASHLTNRTTLTDQQLPPSITPRALTPALQAAEDTLTVTDTIIDTARLLLTKGLPLNAIIQSPAITKFIDAAKERLIIYRKWRPHIANTFAALRASI